MNEQFRTNIRMALAEIKVPEPYIDFLGDVLQEDFADQILIYHTQRDARVDDEYCKPLEGEEFAVGDPFRPTIPDDLHINCRCYWEDKETGEILGQDGFFANIEFGSADENKSMLDGKEGVWRTVRGTKVFFPDDEDPKDVIARTFKTKTNTQLKKTQKEPDKFNQLKKRRESDIEDSKISKENISIINPSEDRINQLTENFKEDNLYDRGLYYNNSFVTDEGKVGFEIRKESSEKHEEFLNAIETRNYAKSDKMYLEQINKDPQLKQRFKEEFEEVQAFNKALAHKAQTTDTLTRFIGSEELESYNDGVFDSNKNRKNGISFTVEKHSKYFGNRDIRIDVPADPIRNRIQPLEYTNLPRNEDFNGFVRDIAFMNEAEVKIPSGTQIPEGMVITYQPQITEDQANIFRERWEHLGEIKFLDELKGMTVDDFR